MNMDNKSDSGSESDNSVTEEFDKHHCIRNIIKKYEHPMRHLSMTSSIATPFVFKDVRLSSYTFERLHEMFIKQELMKCSKSTLNIENISLNDDEFVILKNHNSEIFHQEQSLNSKETFNKLCSLPSINENDDIIMTDKNDFIHSKLRYSRSLDHIHLMYNNNNNNTTNNNDNNNDNGNNNNNNNSNNDNTNNNNNNNISNHINNNNDNINKNNFILPVYDKNEPVQKIYPKFESRENSFRNIQNNKNSDINNINNNNKMIQSKIRSGSKSYDSLDSLLNLASQTSDRSVPVKNNDIIVNSCLITPSINYSRRRSRYKGIGFKEGRRMKKEIELSLKRDLKRDILKFSNNDFINRQQNNEKMIKNMIIQNINNENLKKNPLSFSDENSVPSSESSTNKFINSIIDTVSNQPVSLGDLHDKNIDNNNIVDNTIFKYIDNEKNGNEDEKEGEEDEGEGTDDVNNNTITHWSRTDIESVQMNSIINEIDNIKDIIIRRNSIKKSKGELRTIESSNEDINIDTPKNSNSLNNIQSINKISQSSSSNNFEIFMEEQKIKDMIKEQNRNQDHDQDQDPNPNQSHDHDHGQNLSPNPNQSQNKDEDIKLNDRLEIVNNNESNKEKEELKFNIIDNMIYRNEVLKDDDDSNTKILKKAFSLPLKEKETINSQIDILYSLLYTLQNDQNNLNKNLILEKNGDIDSKMINIEELISDKNKKNYILINKKIRQIYNEFKYIKQQLIYSNKKHEQFNKQKINKSTTSSTTISDTKSNSSNKSSYQKKVLNFKKPVKVITCIPKNKTPSSTTINNNTTYKIHTNCNQEEKQKQKVSIKLRLRISYQLSSETNSK
ncbi:hypothetical protein BCR32DRAFT_294536 [Anaeromyces robustus]|uniref:Uncharacterized protein n=1 Tax=Anaeromyces robustus TaxID=1754192 RepID=A0A1Y1X0X4_9FUNG|nr:hypothetical protein BCR32DRAFT_294536 [Anaeromyces robustus]|eukprot:ORX79258.1 hypothetical protein BCR32DRAFT_294536 [Anaeromyces robustus]